MHLDCQFQDLSGASVFITGGGSGIGAALTEGFLSQGAKVGFVTLSDSARFCDEMQEKYGVRPLGIQCDIQNINELQNAIKHISMVNGDIGVLINNAARDTRHTLSTLSSDDWDASLNTNLKPHFFTAQAVAENMQKSGEGAIINLSSNSYILGLEGYPAYVTAKAAIMGLTKALARELGHHNIRVNCLIPGWVMTERQKKLWVTDDSLAECLEQQSLKSAILPKDIVAPCLFLASNAARMMTGQTLIIDGGRV